MQFDRQTWYKNSAHYQYFQAPIMLKLCQNKLWVPICKQGADPQTGESGPPKGSQGHPTALFTHTTTKNIAV